MTSSDSLIARPFDGHAVSSSAMDDATYEQERADLAGNSPQEAGAYWGQGLARLISKFHRQGWTEQRLSDKEKALGNSGASQPYIHRKIVFGEFLEIMPIRHNGEIPSWLPALTETRFRKHWEMTGALKGDDEARFREAARLIAQSEEWQHKSSNPIRAEYLKHFNDGKPHELSVIAKKVGHDEAVVKDTLDRMTHAQSKAYSKCTKEVDARKTTYTTIPRENMVSSHELSQKLRPIIDSLMVEGRKSAARVSRAQILLLGSQLKELLDDWTQ